jgi:hypothetical protein
VVDMSERKYHDHETTDEEWPVAELLVSNQERKAMRRKWPGFLDIVRSEMPTYVHFVGMVERPGVRLFANKLETTYFWPAGSPRNDLYRFHRAWWMGLSWFIVSIPRKMERFGPRVAGKLGLVIREGKAPVVGKIGKSAVIAATSRPDQFALRVALRAGLPIEHTEWFPLHGPSVGTLEFAEGNPVANTWTSPGMGAVIAALENKMIRENVDLANSQGQRN